MYNFGQFRRNQITDDQGFITDVNYNLSLTYTTSPLVDALYFEDKKLDLGPNNLFSDSGSLSYYIRFKVYKQESQQNIDIKFYNSAKSNATNLEDAYQPISSILVEAGSETDFSIFEFVLTPNNLYDEVHFILNRTMQDYEMPSRDKVNNHDVKGRIINISIEKFGIINNIIEQLSSTLEGRSILKQIGVQSSPGLGMCINGEMIRVGRSGLYEIRNGIDVYYIGFLIDSNSSENNKYFLLDYQY